MIDAFGILQYVQFPTVWLYLAISNIALLVMIYKMKATGKDDELITENSKKTVLFVTAHPDDESMFFVPTVLSMKSMGYKLHVICLSNGNGAGLGKVREKEMEKAAKYLEFDENHMIDDPRLPDGMEAYWDVKAIQEILIDRLSKHSYQGIITFDKKGVSGHVNHISTSFAVHELRKLEAYKDIKMFELVTVNIIRKFIGTFDALFTGVDRLVFLNSRFWINWKAMAIHWSQFVWFRWIYLIFSRYVYINHLNELVFKPSLTAAQQTEQFEDAQIESIAQKKTK